MDLKNIVEGCKSSEPESSKAWKSSMKRQKLLEISSSSGRNAT